MTLTEAAPAKINLALHVVGQRGDGYHQLDSLVAFTEFGDEISVGLAPNRRAGDHRLDLCGPFSGSLAVNADNLVLKALAALDEPLPALDLSLQKKLPVASGIGGGSADAAATLRAVCRLLQCPAPTDAALLKLGADVPVCFYEKSCRMAGIGEALTPLPPLPQAFLVLVNPLVEVSTPSVFKALTQKNNTALPDVPEAGFPDWDRFQNYLKTTRNDLQKPAEQQAHEISDALQLLSGSASSGLVRMSGSGATCFALTQSLEEAEKIASAVLQARPDWWVVPTRLRQA